MSKIFRVLFGHGVIVLQFFILYRYYSINLPCKETSRNMVVTILYPSGNMVVLFIVGDAANK